MLAAIYTVVYFATSLQPNQLSIFTSVLLFAAALINLLAFFLPKFQAMGIDVWHFSESGLSSALFAVRKHQKAALENRRKKTSIGREISQFPSEIRKGVSNREEEKEKDKGIVIVMDDASILSDQTQQIGSAPAPGLVFQQDAGSATGNNALSQARHSLSSVASQSSSANVDANLAVSNPTLNLAASLTNLTAALAKNNFRSSISENVVATPANALKLQDSNTHTDAAGSEDSWLEAVDELKKDYLNKIATVKVRQMELNRIEKRADEAQLNMTEIFDALRLVALNIRLLCHKVHRKENPKSMLPAWIRRNATAKSAGFSNRILTTAEELSALIQIPIEAVEVNTRNFTYRVDSRYEHMLPHAAHSQANGPPTAAFKLQPPRDSIVNAIRTPHANAVTVAIPSAPTVTATADGGAVIGAAVNIMESEPARRARSTSVPLSPSDRQDTLRVHQDSSAL